LDSLNKNKIEWERRSELLKDSIRSVLYKGLPDIVNEHFHNWHKKILLKFVEARGKMKVLDVGCGYGRLSIPIIEKFPDVDIIGLDISENYVRLYKEKTNRPAFIGSIENIPAELGSFDYIICVTVLMYLNGENLKQAIANLLFHLKPDGRLILIEPHFSGIFFQTGFGMLNILKNRIRKDAIATRGRSFRMNELRNLFIHKGGKVLMENRLPVTSLFFLPMVIMGTLVPKRIAKEIYRVLFQLDILLGVLKLPSIYVAYLITKD
jgi:SAM-dependent methyltransferase